MFHSLRIGKEYPCQHQKGISSLQQNEVKSPEIQMNLQKKKRNIITLIKFSLLNLREN